VKQAVTPSLQTLDTYFSYARILVQALLPRRDTGLSANDDHVEVWCVPSATHAPCKHRSQNVLCIRVLFILLSETPFSFLLPAQSVQQNMLVHILVLFMLQNLLLTVSL